MKTLSLSEAKMKLSALIDAINVSDEEVMITRNGAPPQFLSVRMNLKACARQ